MSQRHSLLESANPAEYSTEDVEREKRGKATPKSPPYVPRPPTKPNPNPNLNPKPNPNSKSYSGG